MRMIKKAICNFATLNTQYLSNKSKNAVRFETQNINWDFEELNYQAVALSKGLASLSYQKNDNFLLRVPSAQQAEAYIAKLGTAGISVNLLLSKASTLEEADQEIKQNNIKSIIFEPTLALGEHLYMEALNKLIPELATTGNGSKLQSAKYPSLSSLIQTNFYSYPGVYKFRSVLNYAEDKYYKIPYDAQYDAIPLPSSKHPIIITNAAHPFAFRAGILNSTLNGRYVVVIEPKDVNRIVSNAYDGNADLIATEEIQNLDARVKVYVEKGSELLKGHANRVQL